MRMTVHRALLHRCIFPKFWTQMHHPNLMSAAFTIHTAPQTQIHPSSALRKTVQTWISNNKHWPITTALSALEEMVLAVLEVGGQCGDGGDVLLKSGSLGEKKIIKLYSFSVFYTHWEAWGTFNHELPYNKPKGAFQDQFFSPKTFNTSLNCHSNTLSKHFYITSFTNEHLPRSPDITGVYQHSWTDTCALL